jgi:hypothetical protein
MLRVRGEDVPWERVLWPIDSPFPWGEEGSSPDKPLFPNDHFICHIQFHKWFIGELPPIDSQVHQGDPPGRLSCRAFEAPYWNRAREFDPWYGFFHLVLQPLCDILSDEQVAVRSCIKQGIHFHSSPSRGYLNWKSVLFATNQLFHVDHIAYC